MDLTHLKKLLAENQILPIKSRGQNFLIDEIVLEKIMETADLQPNDTALEVGPGLGILTQELVKQAKKVVSVELDKKLFDFLKKKFAGVPNLELVNQDILQFDWRQLPAGYKVVANLPYQITSRFLRLFLESVQRPAEMTLLVQKEVGERAVASAGQMSLLAVSVQYFGQPQIAALVSRQSFYPQPEVDSVILKISRIKPRLIDEQLQKKFWQMVKIGFSSRRKQLPNNLASGFKISKPQARELLVKIGLNPLARAQDLRVTDWLKLVKIIK